MNKHIFWVTLLVIPFWIRGAAAAEILQSPHDAVNNISCVSCHLYPFNDWQGYSQDPQDIDDTIENFICSGCHGPGGTAPQTVLHSSSGMGSGSRIPGWTSKCVDCHDPHFQMQLDYYQDTGAAAVYLVEASIDNITQDNSDPADVVSRITYSNLNVLHNEWSDPLIWGSKTSAGRGLIFVPDKSSPDATFEVKNADQNEITVHGTVDPFYVGNSFGLIYGQFIKSKIKTAGVAEEARLITPFNGGFANAGENGASGICRHCHTQTNHYSPAAPVNDEHNATARCTECHKHDKGFAPGSCLGCHSVAQDNGDNLPVGGRRGIVSEFPQGDSHAHYGISLDEASCVICHDQATHKDGYVDLFDPDGGPGYRFRDPQDFNSDPDLSNFCSACHDADGATALASPFDPFGSGNMPPDVATRFMGTLQWNEWYGDWCFGYEGSNRPVNSHHDLSDADQAFSGAKLECLNCHGAHAAGKTQPVTNPFDTISAWTGTINEFCLACHGGGAGPLNPGFPEDVAGPTFYTPPPAPPQNIPNTSCGTGLIWDCADGCVDEAEVLVNLGDGVCNSAAGMNLNCTEFNYDEGDCWVNPCTGNDCSTIGGIDSCEYNFSPWYISYSWTNEAHGKDTKRDWNGYPQGGPSYELDCVACHDAHGSYSANNPAGNPYMIRDFVQGSLFIDDGSRTGNQYLSPGVDGEVIIAVPANGPDMARLCEKCHADWMNAYSWHAYDCNACLTCHSHGADWGGHDWVGGDDAVSCNQ